ncbi:MarR family winged helix-turn-helix transcriptional regulator [Aestuariivivens sediminis]|uniref:MarR family winged helix-turn-helix transcriptional regulator n=1 Tax=Aestuariivivens sediminis TaxID=2913557 RepID=UPI001F58C574|nr:MarR family transcriptional regulator [Aestuariivivens sediminis]
MNIEKRILTNANLPVSKKVVVNLLFSYGIINGKLNDVLKPHDISIQQFNVLRILRGQKGKPATLSSIQERMINKMSNTTRLIDKLITKGYVEKEINKNNKRKIDVTITKEGLNFLNDIDILIDSTEQNIVKTLSNDEAQKLIRLLGKIRLIAN